MKLRYFCDLCGTEVPKNTVRCPNCGRYFTAIQCPRCGFRGEEKDFAQGCPKCGYMKISRPSGSVGERKATLTAGRRKDRSRRKRPASARANRSPTPQQPPPPPAPVGLYRLMGIILSLILIALVVILFLR
jgi:DNA-directed RNA polymerase subunit RPC12/RpoP